MKRPLVVLGVFYCLGIILGGWLPINFWIISAIAVMIFIVLFFRQIRPWIFSALVLILILLLGALSLKNAASLPRNHLRNLMFYRYSLFCRLEGFIASQPEFQNNHLGFIFRAQEIQVGQLSYKCCGEVLVEMDFDQELCYGDNLTLVGNLVRPGGDGGGQGYQSFLARQGIYLKMPIKDLLQIKPRQGFNGSEFIRGCFRLRAYLEQSINRYLPALPAGILSAMILGRKRAVPWLVNNAMIRSGTVHILVVSGFNVGIVAYIINLLLKLLCFGRKQRIILTAICLLVYCLITGATNPVIRATVMGLVFLAAYFLKREPDIYNSWVLAALFILVINPRQIFDIGFQLSFMSVLAIVYLYPKLKALVHLENCRVKVLRFVAEGCLVSCSAWLGTLVIIAWNFRLISPVTVLANILIVPLATLITLCGFTLLLAGWVHPGLAYLLSLPTAGLITLLLNINAVLVKLPFACIYF